MRLPRIKSDGIAHYHCLSRIAGQEHVFGDVEKEFFVNLLQKLRAFHGVEILTYCVMSNHFHLLLEMPDALTTADLDREEIIRRVGILYGRDAVEALRGELSRVDATQRLQREEEIFDRYRSQMGDLSVFMKQLKQRFSIWFNRRMRRKGTLWEDRFKSLLVESEDKALLTVAAYIDLNPLRAGIVTRIEDYRWCGYASAVAGDQEARKGLGRIFDRAYWVSGEDHAANWKDTGASYRLLLYGEGEIREFVEPGGRPSRPGFTREQVQEEIARGGKLPLGQVLRIKVRYLSDGVALGSTVFVEEVFERNRARFRSRRTSGARRMGGADWGDLRVIRALRADPFA
ncbi:MAG: hypothetical protein B9S36_00145 [Verrucomicrobiia bacterium Tous-C2TDCM]|nr:MAG: hypothetical protein B9S36_00145 [Verrucomicrobiae bacterium Tous-C2TDCM]